MVLTEAEIEAELDRLMEAPEVDEEQVKVNVFSGIFETSNVFILCRTH